MNIVFSGPSGAGKGTLTEMFLKDNNFKKFTTCTTRKPREGEKDGFDYYFYDKETFLQKVKAQEMFNVKEYGGNYYGSLEEDMDNIQTMKNVIFQITPDRAFEMKGRNSNTCMILIIPPTAELLINRRKDRSEERIKNDIQNLETAKNFDYVIVNDNIEQAYENIKLCIHHFIYGGECEFLVKDNIGLIENLIKGLNTSIEGKGVEKVFNSEIAKKWDQKAEYVTYYGVKNPITEEVMSSAGNGLKIADIGCGTAKIINENSKLPIYYCENFRGLNMGKFQGGLMSDFLNNESVKKAFVNYDFVIPGGESINQLNSRYIKGLDIIRDNYNYDKVAIISHGAAISNIKSKISGEKYEDIDYCIIKYYNNKYTIVESGKYI